MTFVVNWIGFNYFENFVVDYNDSMRRIALGVDTRNYHKMWGCLSKSATHVNCCEKETIMPKQVGVIVGSVRTGRMGKPVAFWIRQSPSGRSGSRSTKTAT